MRPIPYLKGLDILRFLAASLVVLAHAHYHLSQLHIPWLDGCALVYQGGPAVTFFFTLSGVLLTCLGIQEHRLHGRIDVRKFYWRRVLRIWPLYYGVVGLSLLFVFVLLPVFYPVAENRFPMPVSLLCLLFLVPNYLSANRLTSFGPANGLWSIGVEELFYLLFPFLFAGRNKRGRYVFRFVLALLVYAGLYLLMAYSALPVDIKRFLRSYAFQYMLTGCIFAAAWMQCREHTKSLRWFNIMAVAVGVAAFCFSPDMKWPLVASVARAALFSVVILFTAQVDNRFFKNNPLVYFGKISYGIYMFHPFVSYLLRFGCARQEWMLRLVRESPSLYFILLLTGSIVAAHFSYRWYERRFLRLKERAEPA